MLYFGFSDVPAACVEITHRSSRRWTARETHVISLYRYFYGTRRSTYSGNLPVKSNGKGPHFLGKAVYFLFILHRSGKLTKYIEYEAPIRSGRFMRVPSKKRWTQIRKYLLPLGIRIYNILFNTMLYLGFSDVPAVCVDITKRSSGCWTQDETRVILSTSASMAHDISTDSGNLPVKPNGNGPQFLEKAVYFLFILQIRTTHKNYPLLWLKSSGFFIVLLKEERAP